MDIGELASSAEVNEVLAKLETLAKALGLKIIHCPEKYPPSGANKCPCNETAVTVAITWNNTARN